MLGEANPDLPYIRGGNWNLGVFQNNRPCKELLAAIMPDRPAYLFSQTGHEAWLNTKTLELIGLTRESKQDNQYLWNIDYHCTCLFDLSDSKPHRR